MQTAATQHGSFNIRRRASCQPHCSTQLPFPQQEEPQSCSTSVADAFQSFDERQEVALQERTPSPTRQPRCRTPLSFLQQEESASTSVIDAVTEQSCDCRAIAMQDSSNTELCRERQVFSLDVSNFVNNDRMLGIYYYVRSRSSNGDTSNIRAVIRRFSRPLDKITVIDAVCTHVPITLRKVTSEYVVSCLRTGLDMCEDIKLSYAKVLIVRLKRRIACIYFRQGMLKEARQEIDEVEGIITGLLKDCVDVGIADAYWLMAWIRLFEVWGDESELANASQGILHYGGKALEIAQKLPNEDLQKAYSGRISCSFACLKLLLASCNHFQHERAVLEEEANKLVRRTSPCTLAKRDRSLWCRAMLWLNCVRGERQEQILSQIIADCYDVDRSNNVFTVLSVCHRDIELALCDGGGGNGSG